MRTGCGWRCGGRSSRCGPRGCSFSLARRVSTCTRFPTTRCGRLRDSVRQLPFLARLLHPLQRVVRLCGGADSCPTRLLPAPVSTQSAPGAHGASQRGAFQMWGVERCEAGVCRASWREARSLGRPALLLFDTRALPRHLQAPALVITRALEPAHAPHPLSPAPGEASTVSARLSCIVGPPRQQRHGRRLWPGHAVEGGGGE